jgi:hypothetical protein
VPEREKADLLHAGNLLISRFACDRSCVDGFGYFMNRGPASERQHNAARGSPFAKSLHNGAARRVAVVRFEMAFARAWQSVSAGPKSRAVAWEGSPRRGRARPAQSAKARSERSETKVEPVCQFCVSWHTPSWSVLLEMAEMVETDDRAKTRIMLDFQVFCERMDGAARQD